MQDCVLFAVSIFDFTIRHAPSNIFHEKTIHLTDIEIIDSSKVPLSGCGHGNGFTGHGHGG